MSGIKWAIKIGLLGILICLFMVIARNGVSEEPKEKTIPTYEEYVKKANNVIAELEKIDFAISSEAKPNAILGKVKLIDIDMLYSEMTSTLPTFLLLTSSRNYYKDLLTGCVNGGDLKNSSLLKYLQKVAQSFLQTSKIALEKKGNITINDCVLDNGNTRIDCYLCNRSGKCTSCSWSGCKICQQTKLCIACSGSGTIDCPICAIITMAQNPTIQLRLKGDGDNGRISANENSAAGAMKLIAVTEATWYQQDPDGNGKKDFWTLDVSCLHRMYRADGATKVAFIAIDLARADAKPADMKGGELPFGKSPTIEPWDKITLDAKSGYFFRAMLTDDKGNPYNVNGVGMKWIEAAHSSQFAFVAYPAQYGKTGINTFIINQEGTVYATDCGSDKAKVVLQWPGANPVGVAGPGGRNWKVAD